MLRVFLLNLFFFGELCQILMVGLLSFKQSRSEGCLPIPGGAKALSAVFHHRKYQLSVQQEEVES